MQCGLEDCVLAPGCCITGLMTFSKMLLKHVPVRALGFFCCAAVLPLAAALGHAAAAPGSHLLRPTDLRCDDKSEPLAVADAHPEFSWQLTAASPGLHSVSESAYRIQVTADSRGARSPREVLWDSGIVSSSAIFGIVYV